MAATWTIESLERTFELNEESNVVTKIHWNCNDSTTVGEDTYSGRVSGTQPLDTSDLEDFEAYADVTEEVALGWLMDSEDEEVFEEKDKGEWTLAEIMALAPTDHWDTVFASQYDSVITNPPVRPVADNTFELPAV